MKFEIQVEKYFDPGRVETLPESMSLSMNT